MQFFGDVIVLFQHKVLEEETLRFYRTKWRTKGCHPEFGNRHQNYDDEEIVCALMERLVPFLIFCKGGERLILEVEFVRFIDAEYPRSCDFGLRMISRQGSVRLVALDGVMQKAINSLSYTSQGVFADLGNGALRFEIFYKVPATALDPLTRAKIAPCLNEDLRRQKRMFIRG